MTNDDIARSILDGNSYVVLATADADGAPWASPVWYAMANYRELYWVSHPVARHSRNIAGRPQIAMVVFDSTVPPGTGQGVYMRANAEEVVDPDACAAGVAVVSAVSVQRGEQEFTLDDVSGLSNASRLPMILSMTCYSAPFDNPTEDSIGERFLREADKGAVAVFAASWRNAPSTAFSKALVKELLAPGATIGEGIVRAKPAIDDRVLIEMYNLLGDPAVVLKRPVDTVRIALREDRWNPTLGIALPGPHFDGEVDVDWFDADGTRIAGGRYRIAQTRFELPLPRLGDGREAASVRLYAGDPRTGRDATASFDIKAERERIAARTVEPAAESASPRVPPKPTAPDTISSVGFDAEHPQLIAGN